jgi:biofilm PGA synthesis N-glycosyltransferase PgaC
MMRLWPLFIEYAMSIAWAFLFMILAAYRIIDLVFYKIDLESAPVLLLGWTGVLIGTTCMLQMVLSLVLDRPYDRGLLKNYFWAIWYPTIYWLITAATSVVALPKILFRDIEKRATWTSPDRGIRPDSR